MPDPRDDALIAELRELGRLVDVPDPVDQRAAVRARLTGPDPVAAARRRVRRWVAAAAAATVCAVLVTPPARAVVVDAVDGLFRIAGIEVRRDAVPRALPPQPSALPSTESASLAAARRSAKFPIRVPAALGPPEVTVADPDADGAPRVVTLTYRGGRIRLDEFDGDLGLGFMKTAPAAEWTQIGGRTAIWLPKPHPVTYVDRSGTERTESARLAGPVLVWAGEGVTYRLEGVPTLDRAQEIAESLR